MKQFLLFAISILFLTSCAVMPKYEENRYILDFRPYVAEGFMITTAPTINDPHDCIASIMFEVKAGVITTTSDNGIRVISGSGTVENEDGVSIVDNKGWELENPNLDAVLRKFVDYAKSLGADGVIDLQYSRYYYDGVFGQYVSQISGCAIKKSNEL